MTTTVLGAGYAGIMAANRLAGHGEEVALVTPHPWFVERIRLHTVASGARTDARRDLATLLHPAVAEGDRWGTAAIAARTEGLAAGLVRVWALPAVSAIDDDGLTPILDAVGRRGWPRGWQREFDYVEYRGEHWEVPDIKYLFNRVFKRLWADSRDAVVSYSARRGGPVYPAQAWNGQWDALDSENFLYMGWDSHYMLSAVQGVLVEAGLAADVFVKYSYIGDAMR